MSKNVIPSINNDDLDYDQTYLRNKRLPRPDAQFNWTPEMVAEIEKCKNDIHYFAENYFHIVTLDEGKQKINLYPAQRRILKALQKYRFNVINASRQTGKTTLTTIYALWMTCFDEFKRVVIVANKENTAIMILRRVALAYEELPNWLKPGTAQYGKKEIIFANHSSVSISTTTGSAVRGDTVNCIIIDEAAHIEPHLMDDFWASVIPVISSSKKRTTKIFMVSTPKGTGNLFYEIFTKAQKGEDDENMAWHAETLYWHEVPGRGKLWKADMIEALHGDKMLFEQEFNCCSASECEVTILDTTTNEQKRITIGELYKKINENQ